MAEQSSTEFTRAIFKGERFDQHSVPVDVLQELKTYRDFVVDVARQLFFKENPGRERLPKGFVDNFQLSLTAITDGSADCHLARVFEVSSENQPVLITEGFEPDDYFSKAHDLILRVVDCQNTGQEIPEEFPRDSAKFFEKFGRSLEEDESLDFCVSGLKERTIRYNHEVRRAIVNSIETGDATYEMTVELIGRVTKVDKNQEPHIMSILDRSTQRVVDVVLTNDEFYQKAYHAMGVDNALHVSLRGTALVSAKSDRIKQVFAVDVMNFIEASPGLTTRINFLLELEDGWHDGAGIKPSRDIVVFVNQVLEIACFLHNTVPPYLYPTLEGGIQAEWSTSDWELHVLWEKVRDDSKVSVEFMAVYVGENEGVPDFEMTKTYERVHTPNGAGALAHEIATFVGKFNS